MNTVSGRDWFDGEMKGLGLLLRTQEFKSKFPIFTRSLSESVSKNRPVDRSINFGEELGVVMKYKKKPYKIYISIELELADKSNQLSQCSYGVVIADVENKNICRRFHLDYEAYHNQDHRMKEPKPSFHHQQFGELIPSVFSEYSRDEYESSLPGLEKPRFFCMPMSFPVVLHWILREFQPWNDDTLSPIIKSRFWTSAVRKSEETIMLPHLKNWVDYCQNPRRKFSSDQNPECKTFVDRLYLIP